MRRYVRPGYRKHHRTTIWAAAAVLVVLVTASLAVVLPAFGETTTAANGVLPASGQGILPSIADVGGTNFDCNKAGTSYGSPATPSGMRQFQISKATPGSYTDPATGVKFVVSASVGKDPKSHLDFAVSGTMSGTPAVVHHVGVKGGTKVSWYDYYNNAHGAPAGVLSDTNLHSSPDSQYNASTGKFTFNVASITTFCYGPPTVTPSCIAPFDGHTFGGGVEYSAQLLDEGDGCKTDDVVMYTRNNNGNRSAALHPVAEGGEPYKVVEHIAWRGFGDGQNPIKLWYDDTAPYDGGDKREMLLCKTDPRVHATNPFALPAGVEDADVLPAGHTSCMLESTDSAPASGDTDTSRAYSAWIYSNVDGSRGQF
jgi:hypothetical protein